MPPRGEQLHRLPDAGGLVDGQLLLDREVHGQVQERIGAAVLDRVVGLQGRGLVGEVGVVLGVLGDPARGDRGHRVQRRRDALRRVAGAEESPHIRRVGLEHPRIVALTADITP